MVWVHVLSEYRQFNGESGAPRQFGLDPDRTSGALDDALAERQSKTVAGAAVAREKRLEDARLQIGAHPHAAVGGDEDAALAIAVDLDQQVAGLAGAVCCCEGSQGVLQQIVDDLEEQRM